jgi:hypothetical protein
VSNDGLRPELVQELCRALKLKELPSEFACILSNGLSSYPLHRDLEREMLPKAIAYRRRGRPHHGRWMLRQFVFGALVSIDVDVFRGRRSAAAKVMALMLEEADRLDGKQNDARPQARFEFSSRQWSEWRAEFFDGDDGNPLTQVVFNRAEED